MFQYFPRGFVNSSLAAIIATIFLAILASAMPRTAHAGLADMNPGNRAMSVANRTTPVLPATASPTATQATSGAVPIGSARGMTYRYTPTLPATASPTATQAISGDVPIGTGSDNAGGCTGIVGVGCGTSNRTTPTLPVTASTTATQATSGDVPIGPARGMVNRYVPPVRQTVGQPIILVPSPND